MLGKERDSLFYGETIGLVNTAELKQRRFITRDMRRTLVENRSSGYSRYAANATENSIKAFLKKFN